MLVTQIRSLVEQWEAWEWISRKAKEVMIPISRMDDDAIFKGISL